MIPQAWWFKTHFYYNNNLVCCVLWEYLCILRCKLSTLVQFLLPFFLSLIEMGDFLCFALCFSSFCCFFSFLFFSSGIFLLPTYYGLLGFNFSGRKTHQLCPLCRIMCVCVLQDFSSKKSSCTSSKLLRRTTSMSFLLTKFYAQLGLIFKNRIWTGNLFFNLRTRPRPEFSISVNMCWICFSSVNLTTFAN